MLNGIDWVTLSQSIGLESSKRMSTLVLFWALSWTSIRASWPGTDLVATGSGGIYCLTGARTLKPVGAIVIQPIHS